ncbi:TPA: replication protein [Stenotrophomonas maltophilia]|jgi:hypothetical protein|nr:replication protein [Stenotrophomonas maltophilia]HEL3773476.1 replication protein [Stenotrophomonas maltophilia]
MPVLTVYPHGGKGGVAPMKNNHQRVPRGDVQGWSEGATRRNTEFLMSVRTDQLTGAGVALTLTVRDCPPTSDDWHRLLKAWAMRMQRAGMIRLHWVTEWQRRGVPHLHCAIWFPDAYDTITPTRAWVEVASAYGAGLRGQHARIIDGPVGWFQYLAKHAARGVKHYQRTADSIPEGWQKKTGRVWGKWGHWPVQEKVRINLQDQHGDGGWFAYRRLVRSWRLADARSAGDAYRIRSARAMLQCPDQVRARLIGYSEWMPYEVQMALIGNVAARGFEVTS